MAIEDRLEQLDYRHRDLDQRIQSEITHPSSDDLRLAALKRQKLALKDEIETLRRTP